jgi:hypothetical protein
MKSLRSDSGQTLVIIALCMTVLLGFVALAVDVGSLFHARRNMQVAADAAAVAGALDYKYNSSVTSARAAGQAAAAANGVSSSYITINIPPGSGSHATSGYVEAIAVDPAPTFFMNMFHIHSMNVSARAVAGSGVNNGCVWALSKSGTDVSLTGSGSITAQNCEIYDDSNASNAMSLTGSGSISAKAIGIVGNNPGYSVTGSGSLSPNPPTTGIGPATDPLNLTAPAIPTGTCSSSCTPSNTGSGNLTLNPGTYTSISNTGSGTLTLTPGNYIINGSLTNTGSGSLILGAGNYTIGGDFKSTGSSSLTLGSGIYTIGGNLALTGSGSMTGSGITFYTLGSDTLTGSGSMNLAAPTSGTYSGVLIYQPSSNTNAMSITGSGGDNIKGILYAPRAGLTLTGSGSLHVSLDMIVDTLKVTGSGSIVDTNYSVVTNTNSVLSKLVMVE